MTTKPPAHEPHQVALRYARRESAALANRYSPLQPDVWHTLQERQRALLQLLVQKGCTDLAQLHATDVGCGTGDTLLDLLRLGFAPQHLQGLELLPARFERARSVLPPSIRLILGDATQAPVAPASQDLVLQNTVFSSLLDDAFQQQLARAMWRWVKPGGAVLWYDFTVNNPRNADVRGVPLARVQQLFPQARITARRVTLAPPLARVVCRVHPALYPVFNSLPLLRTHVLAWLAKPLL
jgi:SAM-dependent methyltransferase